MNKIWFLETDSVQEIQTGASIRPMEIAKPDQEKADNELEKSRFIYPMTKFHLLPEPITPAQLKEIYSIDPPQTFCLTPPHFLSHMKDKYHLAEHYQLIHREERVKIKQDLPEDDGPSTDCSATDILLAITPAEITFIITLGIKLKLKCFQLPPSTQHIWFFETDNVQEITSVASILPEDLDYVNKGWSQKDWDSLAPGDKCSAWIYPLESIRLLPNPVSITDLKEKHKLEPPQKYCYMPKSLLSQLPIDEIPLLERWWRDPPDYVEEFTEEPMKKEESHQEIVVKEEEVQSYSILFSQTEDRDSSPDPIFDRDNHSPSDEVWDEEELRSELLETSEPIEHWSNESEQDINDFNTHPPYNWGSDNTEDDDERPGYHCFHNHHHHEEEEEESNMSDAGSWDYNTRTYDSSDEDIPELWSSDSEEELESSPDAQSKYSDYMKRNELTLNPHKSQYIAGEQPLQMAYNRRAASLYPEVRLLNQLRSESPPQLPQAPIQVFSMTVPVIPTTSETWYTPITREEITAHILTEEDCTTQDVYFKLLTSMRATIREGIHRISEKLITDHWRAFIDQRESHDPIRMYFYHRCFLFRYLEPNNSSKNPIKLLPVEPKEYDPTKSNPLLFPGEMEFLYNACDVFYPVDPHFAGLVQSVLDMRFREPTQIARLLHQGLLEGQENQYKF